MIYLSRTLFIIGLLSFLTACGGSSGEAKPPVTAYNGKLTKAVISPDNNKPLSNASSEASSSIDSAGTFSSFKTGSTGSTDFDLKSLLQKTTSTALQYPTESIPDFCSSGKLSIQYSDTITDPYNEYLDISVIYNSCTIDGSIPSIKVDGKARYQGYLFGDFTMTFTNFTIWEGSDAQTINMTLSCIDLTNTCTVSTDIKGYDGRVYRIENLTTTGTDYSGYTINGRVYDPDHGYIDITTTSSIYFSCPTDRPGSGQIQFTDDTSTVTVTYNSCTSYTVDLDGVPTNYTW